MNSFLNGTGLGAFVPNSVKVNGIHGNVWLLQPVHNIYLLLLSETGIFGLLMFFLAFSILTKNNKKTLNLYLVLIFVFLTGFLDHYWITLQQNTLVLVFVIFLLLKKPAEIE